GRRREGDPRSAHAAARVRGDRSSGLRVGVEALQRYSEFRPHLVLLDVKMQGMDGLETLRKLRELDAHAQGVMISGHGTIQTAVEATQRGGYEFLEKPLGTDRILLTLRNALQHLDLESENVGFKAEVHAQYGI